MHQEMINKNDLVWFDESDFENAGSTAFYEESGSFDSLSLPDVKVERMFIRITCPERQALQEVQDLGERFSQKYPNAELRWALNVSKSERKIQVIGV